MTTSAYMSNRRKYHRPQAMMFSTTPGTLVPLDPENPAAGSVYVPTGYELGSDGSVIADSPANAGEFLILSDHNRSAIDFKNVRLEKKERMVNGRMRSYHIADKIGISASWDMLPSRGFSASPEFDENGIPVLRQKGTTTDGMSQMYTADGGAGGVELLNWYENHTGSFWVFLSYDRYDNFASAETKYNNLGIYSDVIEVFFSDFSYSVEKRGQSFDFWNISLSLEEA